MMSNLEPKSIDELLSNPVTASVFVYLRLQDQPSGVRQVQRALNLGSPSTAHWHLKKLLEQNVIQQLQGSKYKITEAFSKVNKVPLPVVMNHYIVGSRVVPGIFLLLTFLIISTISTFIMIITENFAQSSVTGFFSLIITVLLIFRIYFQSTKPKIGD